MPWRKAALIGFVLLGFSKNLNAQAPYPLLWVPTAEQQIKMTEAADRWWRSARRFVGLETPECAAAGRIFAMVDTRHYRKIATPEEFAARLNRAGEAYRKKLGLSEKDVETFSLKGLLSRGTVAGVHKKNWVLNCRFAEKVSGLSQERVTVDGVWDAVINGVLAEMDPHSHLFIGADVPRIRARGHEPTGVDMELETRAGGSVVVATVGPDSRAEQAGIEAGDRLLEIRDRNQVWKAEETPLGLLQSALLGRKDTRLQLKFEKPKRRVVDVEIERETYEPQVVRAREIETGLLYVKLTRFGPGAAKQLRRAIEHFAPDQGVILDLRSNPGGMLDEAVRVVDLFIDRGSVVHVRNRNGRLGFGFGCSAGEAGAVTDVPLVVLINDKSVSASEIVAQSLSKSDYARAILVGRRTFGKGTVSGEYNLGPNRLLWLTEGVYYTAGGVSPHARGVAPDVTAADRKIAGMLQDRRYQARRGRRLPAWREENEPFRIPAPEPMTFAELKTAGSRPDRGVWGNLLAWVLPEDTGRRIEKAEDPGEETAREVLRAVARAPRATSGR